MNQEAQPLVSVVIPCYNHEKFVQDCIQSVIDQTYENIELIIIDDGSKDNSVEKIKEMVQKCKERFVRFDFRARVNKGVSSTLNEALEWCTGEYISPIASDDQMLNNKIEIQVEFLDKNTNYVAVFGGINQIDDNNKYIRTLTKKSRSYSFDDIARLDYFLQAPTQFFRLKDIIDIGGYSEEFKIEDWYSYLKLTMSGKLIYLMEDVICNYRRHANNGSKNMQLMLEKIRIIQNIGLNDEEVKHYIPYIYMSLSSDLAISQKRRSMQFFLKSVFSNLKLVGSVRTLKIFVKICVPKFFLWKNK